MDIRDKKDVELAYIFIRYADLARKEGITLPEGSMTKIIEVKRDLRAYYKQQDQACTRRIVQDLGIDGYTEIVELPEYIQTMDCAEDYFNEIEKLTYRNSQYDCTGQLFTVWHSIVNRRGRMWLCHKVRADV